jgi:hypothetical protein
MIKIGTMVVVMQTYPIQPFATLSNHRFAIDEITCGNNAARVTASLHQILYPLAPASRGFSSPTVFVTKDAG